MTTARKYPPQRTTLLAALFEGGLRIEQRNANAILYARTFLSGKPLGNSTGEITLGAAKTAATKWRLDLLAQQRLGIAIHGETFEVAARAFLTDQDHIKAVSDGQRNNHHSKWRLLQPHLTGIRLTAIDLSWLEQLRNRRSRDLNRSGAAISSSTLKKDFIVIRLVLRHALERTKTLASVPTFPSFAERKWKIHARPRRFLTAAEYAVLQQTALTRINNPAITDRQRSTRQVLFWFMELCVGGCLRVDEARSLRFRDCVLSTVMVGTTARAVLLMKVLGKHSLNGDDREEAFGLAGAVSAFTALPKRRPQAQADDLLFPSLHRRQFRELLEAAQLRVTATGDTRNMKSLRSTGICL